MMQKKPDKIRIPRQKERLCIPEAPKFCIITTHFCEKNSKNGPKFPVNPKSSILVRSLRTLRPTGYFSRSSDFVVKKIIEIPSKNTLLLELFEIQTDFLKIFVHKYFRI